MDMRPTLNKDFIIIILLTTLSKWSKNRATMSAIFRHNRIKSLISQPFYYKLEDFRIYCCYK